MEKTYTNEQSRAYDAAIQWYVTSACNFSCLQCGGFSKKLKGPFAPEKINIPALMNYLNKSGKTFKLIFTGGEPLCVENIVDAFSEITKKHYIAINTNLVSSRVKEIAGIIDSNRVEYIAASAHMMELEKRKLVDIFINNFLLLKSKGFNIGVKIIAYPFFIRKVSDYEKFFNNYGMDVVFIPFRGIWENKKYPDDYTEEEINLFNLNKLAYQSTNIFNRKDKLCNVGYNVFVAAKNGEINTCFSIHKNIGNIYKKIKFSKRLIKCPFDLCYCPFPVYEPYLFEKALRETKMNV